MLIARCSNTASKSIIVRLSNHLFTIGHATTTYHPSSSRTIPFEQSYSLSVSCTTVPNDGILQVDALHMYAALSSLVFARAWRPRLFRSIDKEEKWSMKKAVSRLL
jgi:hypothetical protein